MRRIFGSFDKADLAEPYFASMEKVTDAWFYIIQYKRDGYWEDVEPTENTTLIRMDKRYSGNTGKLNDWYNEYKKLDIRPTDWCIFTDMHDVVFQRDIPELPDDKIALVCYEGKTFGEIGFWRNIMPVSMHKDKAYNCGVFAMKSDVFAEYLRLVHEGYQNMIAWKKSFSATVMGKGFPFISQYVTDLVSTHIGSIYNGIADTFIFNEYINTLLDAIEWSDVCNYNFLVETGKAQLKYRKLCDMKGKPFVIAHYNGNAKAGKVGRDA